MSEKSVPRLSFVHCPQDELGKKYHILIDFCTPSSQVGLEWNKCNDVRDFLDVSYSRLQTNYSLRCHFW